MEITGQNIEKFDLDMTCLASSLKSVYDSYKKCFQTGFFLTKNYCMLQNEYRTRLNDKNEEEKYEIIQVQCYGRPLSCYKIAKYLEEKYGLIVDFKICSDYPANYEYEHIYIGLR